MTPELAAFLKQNNNLDLIGQKDFYTLFKNCPHNLKYHLLKMLDESNIDIINTLEQDDTYYCLKANNKVLSINRKDQKSNSYTYSYRTLQGKEDWIRMIIFPSFETALRNGINQFSTTSNPEPVKQNFIDKYQWKEVEIASFNKVKALITQDCIDLFDPNKIKERRIKDAAQEEYNRRLQSEILNKLLIDRNKLKEELTPFIIEDKDGYKDVGIFTHNDYIEIDMNYDLSDKKQIESIIKKNLRYPANITGVNPGENFEIVPIGKRVDLIKSEVEEEFGVNL